ncbi:MAG TPA: alpha/beta fold hydrolase [Phototrophicaceae bacterium]|jgi:dienelactone hydrolase|nr:alpha/beta fold hydrolase [Phototrophicaceae bacterium]
MMRRIILISLMIIATAFAISALPVLTFAQDAPTQDPADPALAPAPTATTVEFTPLEVSISAPDGKILYGAYFSKSDTDGRAVLLLHQMYTDHTSWSPLIYPLMDAGYKVLAVDLRGYGKTRGKLGWTAAQDDTVAWANWLKTQPGVTSIATVGSSMGSTLALIGCSQIEGCVGAVAISPGLNYYNVYTGDAVQAGFPSLLIYAENDRYPKEDVPQLKELGGDSVQVQMYEGRQHGIDLFDVYDDLIPFIVTWIGER